MQNNEDQPILNFAASELRTWKDWYSSLAITIHTLVKSPFLVLSLLITSCISCTVPESSGYAPLRLLVAFTLMLISVGLTCKLVPITWAHLNGQLRQITNTDLALVGGAFANTLIYSTLAVAGGFLLLLPGIIIATKASLGIAFICIEKRTAIAAFKESWKMTKGHFWLVFRYLAPVILMVCAGFAITYATAYLVDPAVMEDSAFSSWTWSIQHLPVVTMLVLACFLLELFYISITPLQVKLYAYLRKSSQDSQPNKPVIMEPAQLVRAPVATPAIRMADGASPFKLRQVIRKQICLICNQEFELSDDIEACPADGSMLSPVFDDPFINSVIDDKYQILERIASGGTSKIYKAKHLTLDRYVALKVLQGAQEITEAQLGRFQKEAQVAIGLVNPNIVRVFDYGTHPQPYIVMEYVEGKTLGALIEEKGALPARSVLAYFIQVCEAMSLAHAAGLVHRDIKPSNVIVEQSSNIAKVLDFGLVKDFIDDGRYTRTGETVGSPAYMSPEQCKGLELDARSDIYSLGCVMYEVLTGKSPFGGDNTVECMFKHLETPAPPLRKTRRDLKFPPGLEKVISNCLAKEAEERYQSMEDLKKDLDAVVKNRPRNVRTFKTRKTRTKLKVGLFGIALSLTVGALALAIVFGHKPPPILPNPNKLAVGAQAKNKGVISIALHPPIVLNGKTKEQIFSIRQAQLNSHNDLLAAKYTPFDPIFAHVDYGSPWLSIKGLAFTKNDGLSITEGESWESIWITNPLLLVAPEFMEGPIWNERLIGNPDKIKNFPYQCLPRDLVWNPVNRLMEVTYDMDEYSERVIEVNDFKEPLGLMNGMNVSLDTMNARDLGYNFMKVEVEGDGTGKQASSGPTQLAMSLIANNFHGCRNNHGHPPDGRLGYWSPSVRIRPPCTERVMLYKIEPRSSQQAPDMTCLIRFNYHRDGHENALNFLERRKQEVVRVEGSDSTSLVSIYRRLGDAYVKEEKLPEVQDSYGHALKIASERTVSELDDILGELSSFFAHEARTADAQIDKLAKRQDWLPYASSIAKGVCFYNHYNPDRAILHFDAAISQRPNCAPLHVWRGTALKWMGRYKEAISDYSEALRLDKEWTTLKDSIKECESDRENSVKSGSGLIAALADITRPTRVPYLIAAFYEGSGLDKFEEGQYAKAASDFNDALELYGWSSSHSIYMSIMGSLSYSFAHNDASSQELLCLAESKMGSGVWPHPIISYLRGRITKEQLLTLAGKDNDKLTEAWTYIGLDLMLTNRISEAKDYFKQVVDKGNKEFIEYRLANTKLEKLR